MYDDWSDIDLAWDEGSVLDRLTPSVARTVAISVVDDLARQITANSCPLATDTEVRWCMQVLCYGLGLPFSTDYSTVRNVVKIYCDWLTCLVDEPSIAVPPPLLEQPSKYSRDIINHLHYLFVPRSESGPDVILRQAKECHYVLRCLQHVAVRCKDDIKGEIWPEILRFLLSVNDALLSPPYEHDDISDQLCTRMLGVLFEVWISSCFIGQFPTPSFWKTFRSLCHNWRHRVALVDEWARACYVLTSVQLRNLYGPNYCKMKLAPDDQKLVPLDADPTLVAQTWFRILHLIGSPADILNSHNFDNSPKFREYISRRSADTGVMEPSQHPCLNHLPYCFFRAVFCVNSLVSCFLGENVDCVTRGSEMPSSEQASTQGHQLPPPQQTVTQVPFRRGGNAKPKENRSQSVYVGKSSAPIPTSIPTPDSILISNVLKNTLLKYQLNIPYSPSKPTVDSLLRLFGEWLFACAAVKPVEQKRSLQDDALSQKSMGSHHSAPEGMETGSVTAMSQSSSQSELPRLSSDNIGCMSGVQAGKAEAAAALCKILCSRVISEKIAENQVAKYCALLLDLFSHDDYMAHASVIFHGVNVFRAGLRGIELLVPYFLDCLDHFIADPERVGVHPSIVDVELRRACLDLLGSIIVYPTHFGTSAFSDINRNTEQHTFIGFRARVLRILLNSLKLETDSGNIQVALGLLCIFYQSCCYYELNAGTLQNMNYVKEVLRAILALLSDCLCGKWSSDYAVCISALDCFVALSDVGECEQCYDMSIFDRVIISICRFIEIQLSRPPPAHSRDLHSTVVAAYSCLESWIVAFPCILQDDLCLSHVTDTIQLGVTGAKPQSKEMDATDTKKPASQRVNDAAEQLLHTMFCRAGAPFSIHEPMEDETFMMKTLGITSDSVERQRQRYLYALLDNTSLISILEVETRNEKNEVVPAAAVVLRSPFAAVSSWIFRLDTPTKGREGAKRSFTRPEVVDLTRPRYSLPVCVPPDVDRFGRCKADASIPPLRLTTEAERMRTYIEEVGKQQKWFNLKQDPQFTRLDMKPPTHDGSVRTARLLLQDLGYLNLDSPEKRFHLISSTDVSGTTSTAFLYDLASIDRCPARFIHTAHLFYVECGKTSTSDILTNGAQIDKTAACFRRFLSALGVAIDIGKDRVWTGHWRSAYVDNTDAETSHSIDGLSHALYWASPLTEIAFVMPATASQRSDKPSVTSATGAANTANKPLSTNATGSCAGSLEDLTIKEDDESDRDGEEGESSSLLDVTDPSDASPSPAFRRRPAARLRTCVRAIAFLGRRKPLTTDYVPAIGPAPMHALPEDDWPRSYGPVAEPQDGSTNRPATRSNSMSQDCESVKTVASSASVKSRKAQTYQDYRFIIIWLEKFEDYAAVPLDELAPLADIGEPGQSSDCHRYVVFICPYENGLYRIKLSIHWSKLGFPSPLVDGVIVSEDVLSSAIRQCILCIGARRRLEQEGYMPPFVKRRQKINDFAAKYAMNASPAEIFHTLLSQ